MPRALFMPYDPFVFNGSSVFQECYMHIITIFVYVTVSSLFRVFCMLMRIHICLFSTGKK